PRVTGITDAVPIVVTLVVVGDAGAIVLLVQDAIVVDVFVARVADPVTVGVALVGIGNGGTVVAGVVHAVPLGIHDPHPPRDAEGIRAVRVPWTMVERVGDPVVVIIRVASVANAVVIGVELVRVGDGRTVVHGVGHAIAVDVVIARVALPVAVAVVLIRIGDIRAVVARVSHPVPVRVRLVPVGDGGTVVDDVLAAVAIPVEDVRQGHVAGVTHPRRGVGTIRRADDGTTADRSEALGISWAGNCRSGDRRGLQVDAQSGRVGGIARDRQRGRA